MKLPPDELRRRIAAGEGARLEFKRGLPSPDKVARTLAAFGNTKGGLFLVGVGDDGQLLGSHDPRGVTEALGAIAATRVDPPLEVVLEVVDLDGRRVVVCLVPASRARPHAALLEDGTRDVCVRLGSSTRTAGGAALAALQSAPSAASACSALERDALAWLARRRDPGARGAVGTTADDFAAARNIGRSRARRAFVTLERAGLIVGHGGGAARVYALPE